MTKNITFYYVRHGRTEFNRDGIMQGLADSPLAEEGIPVLKQTADALKDIPFDRCFSSPLSRAIHTAEIITEGRGIVVEPLEDLIEMNFGRIDGKPHREHRTAMRICHLFDSFRLIGGNSYRDMKKRARKAMETLVRECSDGDHVLLCGHGSYYRYLIRELFHKSRLGLKKDPAWNGIGNGSISVFSYNDGTWNLWCYPLSAEALTERYRTMMEEKPYETHSD